MVCDTSGSTLGEEAYLGGPEPAWPSHELREASLVKVPKRCLASRCGTPLPLRGAEVARARASRRGLVVQLLCRRRQARVERVRQRLRAALGSKPRARADGFEPTKRRHLGKGGNPTAVARACANEPQSLWKYPSLGRARTLRTNARCGSPGTRSILCQTCVSGFWFLVRRCQPHIDARVSLTNCDYGLAAFKGTKL